MKHAVYLQVIIMMILTGMRPMAANIHHCADNLTEKHRWPLIQAKVMYVHLLSTNTSVQCTLHLKCMCPTTDDTVNGAAHPTIGDTTTAITTSRRGVVAAHLNETHALAARRKVARWNWFLRLHCRSQRQPARPSSAAASHQQLSGSRPSARNAVCRRNRLRSISLRASKCAPLQHKYAVTHSAETRMRWLVARI